MLIGAQEQLALWLGNPAGPFIERLTMSNASANAAVQKAFNEAVIGQINDDRNHGWGAADSKAVIEAVIMEDVLQFREVKENADKVYGPSAKAMELIGEVVNPSAFRQKLESAKRPDGQTVLAKSEKKASEKRTLALYS